MNIIFFMTLKKMVLFDLIEMGFGYKSTENRGFTKKFCMKK